MPKKIVFLFLLQSFILNSMEIDKKQEDSKQPLSLQTLCTLALARQFNFTTEAFDENSEKHLDKQLKSKLAPLPHDLTQDLSTYYNENPMSCIQKIFSNDPEKKNLHWDTNGSHVLWVNRKNKDLRYKITVFDTLQKHICKTVSLGSKKIKHAIFAPNKRYIILQRKNTLELVDIVTKEICFTQIPKEFEMQGIIDRTKDIEFVTKKHKYYVPWPTLYKIVAFDDGVQFKNELIQLQTSIPANELKYADLVSNQWYRRVDFNVVLTQQDSKKQFKNLKNLNNKLQDAKIEYGYIDPSGNYLAAVSKNETLSLWDIMKKKCIQEIPNAFELPIKKLLWNDPALLYAVDKNDNLHSISMRQLYLAKALSKAL